MRRNKSFGLSLSLAISLLAAGQASAGVLSTFDSAKEGWDVAGFSSLGSGYPNFATVTVSSAVVYNASGGNPGGYISKQDPDGYIEYFRAPAAFLGDQSAEVGGSLTFNLLRLDNFSPNGIAPVAPAVAVGNASLKLVYAGAVASPTTSGWSSYNVPIVSDGSWRVGDPTGAAATQAQLTAVFSALTNLYIKLDFFQGNSTNGEIIGLDNVNLASSVAATPEPSSAVTCLGGLGLLLMGVRSARRRRAAGSLAC